MPSNAELAKQLKEEREKNAELASKVNEGAPVEPDKELIAKVEALEGELVEVKKSKAEIEKSITESISKMEVPTIVNGQTEKGIKVMTAEEYGEYSKANGRIMGREKGQKTKCSIEELRALINSNWTPSMVMDKHGIDAEELKQLVWKLSKQELRDNPIKYSIERNMFSKEG